MLTKLKREYEAQYEAYKKLEQIAREQAGLEGLYNSYHMKELALAKEKILEELALREDYLRIMKNEICNNLSLEEFNLSSLKNKLEGEEFTYFAGILEKTGKLVKEIADLEKENEDNLKRFLKIR